MYLQVVGVLWLHLQLTDLEVAKMHTAKTGSDLQLANVHTACELTVRLPVSAVHFCNFQVQRLQRPVQECKFQVAEQTCCINATSRLNRVKNLPAF